MKKKFLNLPRNVLTLGWVSFWNDLASEMIFPFLPIFLKNYLGASSIFIGLIEGLADSIASILKVFSGHLSDKLNKRKALVVFGYSLSAVAKPLLSIAAVPWHALLIRFFDRVGKGIREAPRDALMSFSVSQDIFGKAFGFQRALDTLGGAAGPILAFLILPILANDLRKLFLLSFFASFVAVFLLIFFVEEKRSLAPESQAKISDPKLKNLGAPFLIFVTIATIFSLGKASEAFLLLRAENLGLSLALLPVIYLVYNLTYALFSTPAGILADKIGHRNTFFIGVLIFAASYFFLAKAESVFVLWFIFAFYGLYSALTDGVGRSIVADLVSEENRGLAYGIYNGATGLALLPASVIFGFIWDKLGVSAAFTYGATMALIAIICFILFFKTKRYPSKLS